MPVKRGDRWIGRIKIDGKHVWCGTHSTKREAVTAEVEKRKEIEDARWTEETCDSFAARWMRDYPYGVKGKPRRKTSVAHYDEQVRKFAKDFRGVPLKDVSRPDARAWARENRARAKAVCTMFTDAYNDGLIERNVWLHLGLPRSENSERIEALTVEEFYRVAGLCEQAHGPMFRAMFVFAGWTGCRPGELFELRRKDLDLDNGLLKVSRQRTRHREVTDPKTDGGIRTVVLLPEAQAAFRDIPSRMDGLLFVQKRGSQFTQAALTRYWEPVRLAFGQPKLNWYKATKHFCASQLANKGLSGQDIALQLGHSDEGQTAFKHYVHTYKEESRERVRRAFSQNVVELQSVDSRERKAGNG